jgi:hypothetical protein
VNINEFSLEFVYYPYSILLARFFLRVLICTPFGKQKSFTTILLGHVLILGFSLNMYKVCGYTGTSFSKSYFVIYAGSTPIIKNSVKMEFFFVYL